jgi:hypothetical protein
MTQPDEDTTKRMHRWFAIECNNNAWDLAAKPVLTADDGRDLLATAYASAFHWKAIGNPINRTRADMLLGYVHALLGEGGRATRYALDAVSGLDADGASDWDRAFAHLVMAMAYRTAGDGETFGTALTKAETLGERLERASDREVFKAYLERAKNHPSRD